MTNDDVIDELLILKKWELIEKVKESLNAFCKYIQIPGAPINEDEDCEKFYPDNVIPAAHHKIINAALERIASKKSKRLMLFLPPGSAKSTYASVVFPTWFMGNNPGKNIISTSYGSDLAKKFGRRCRQIVGSKEYFEVFDTALNSDNKAADNWSLDNDSTYMSGGILSGITGNRADGLVIDDPVKGREEAESSTWRNKTWEAYLSDLLTRLKPNGWIVIIQCMTGDTPVLISSGIEKPLRDIRAGEYVATYNKGVLSTSKVLKWRSNGHDSVYKIRTASGIIVRANKRHPFLVDDNGEERWIRLKDLKLGMSLVVLRGAKDPQGHKSRLDCAQLAKQQKVITRKTQTLLIEGLGIMGNIKGKLAKLMGVVSRRTATAYVNHTMAKQNGHLVEIGQHQNSTMHAGLKAAMESPLMITIEWLKNKAEGAQYAVNFRQHIIQERTGTGSFVSTIATTQKKLGHCFVITAILQLVMQKPKRRHWQSPNTSDFTTDKIVEITPDGVEEVFDMQIEGTENFIANSVVSHNTRWHADDLSGRILPDNYSGESGMIAAKDGEQWEVICLQAECKRTDDPLGREIGEYLWTDWFTIEHWEQVKRTQGSKNWSALYQQSPKLEQGGIIESGWFKYFKANPVPMRIVQSWDTAQKEKELNDFTVCTTWIETAAGYFLIDVFKERMNYPKLRRAILSKYNQFNPDAILIEDKGSGISIIQSLREDTMLPVIPIEPEGNKEFRLSSVSPLFESGRVFIKEDAGWRIDLELEITTFPNVSHDDQVDSVSQFLNWAKAPQEILIG